MSLTLIPAAQAVQRLVDFDSVIDARSESEYAEDHLPGALNWPTLNDAERQFIGTTYKQVNAFEAKKRGAALAARNISTHIEREVIAKTRDWSPLLYCWRGGKRSGSLALVLDQIGFRVHLVEGGYKAFRAAMLQDIEARCGALRFQVVCGTTGSGKTRLLHALQRAGEQVLDLEALAQHRSSVLGAIPGVPQPSQKRFDTLVWDALSGYDSARVVFVESESKKVGNVAVAEPLMQRIRQSPCINAYFVANPAHFCNRLEVLTAQRGKAVVQAWKDSVLGGDLGTVVQDLLLTHYDPVYVQSMQRNFSQFPQAIPLQPADRSASAMDAAAQELRNSVPG